MSKKKIETLTQDQINLFPTYVNKWLKHGLSTEPVDIEQAKKAARKAYRLAGLKEPTQFYLVDSPIAAIDLIKKLDPSKSKSDIIQQMSYGNHESYWIGFYDYFLNEVNLEGLEILEGLSDLAKTSGWVSFYEDVVVFQHRPVSIHFDEDNRLHCADNPAIRFRDGFSVYAWHGTQVPQEWIEDPLSLTSHIALTWKNIEQRRCACEILGWTKILEDLKAKIIDADDDPQIGTLVEVELPDIGKEKFLKVLCGTGREFAIPVPPEMKTAIEAQAWTWGMTPKEFGVGPEIRT